MSKDNQNPSQEDRLKKLLAQLNKVEKMAEEMDAAADEVERRVNAGEGTRNDYVIGQDHDGVEIVDLRAHPQEVDLTIRVPSIYGVLRGLSKQAEEQGASNASVPDEIVCASIVANALVAAVNAITEHVEISRLTNISGPDVLEAFITSSALLINEAAQQTGADKSKLASEYVSKFMVEVGDIERFVEKRARGDSGVRDVQPVVTGAQEQAAEKATEDLLKSARPQGEA